jgi:hypothetical protein
MYSENHFKTTKLMFLCASLLVMLAFTAMMAHSEGSVGVGFSQSVDGEVSVGVQGQYETGKVDIDYEYQGIDFHDAKVNIAYRHAFSWIEASIFQENDWTGYSPTNLNRTNDLGIAASVPYVGLDWEVAVFGRNGNTAAPIVKYDEDTGEIISEVPGLTPVDGTHPNVSLATQWNLRDIEIEAKILSNIADAPTPQWLLDASTTGDIGPFQWVLSGLYKGQRHTGETEHEFSSLLTLGVDW